MILPRRGVSWALECLNKNYTINIRNLKNRDFEKKSKEELVAEKLMGKKEYNIGQIGIFENKIYIYTKRGWAAVKANKQGKHTLER